MFLRDLDFLNPPLKRNTPAVLLARLFPQFYPELYFHVYPTGWIVHHYNGTHAAARARSMFSKSEYSRDIRGI